MPEAMSKGGGVRVTILNAFNDSVENTFKVVHAYAGESLWINLRIDCDLEGVEIILATMQLKAKLLLSEEEGIVDLIKMKRILTSRSNSIGGGNFLRDEGSSSGKGDEGEERGIHFWSSMPCVVAAGVTPTVSQTEIYEWIFKIPPQLPPSIEGHFLKVEYWVEAKVELKYKEVDRVMKVIQKVMIHSSPDTDQRSVPTAKINFATLSQIQHSPPYSRSIKDKTPSVWRRLLLEGTIPKSIRDFKSNPLHPLNDLLIKSEIDSEEGEVAKASLLFKSMALSSTSRQYSLKSNDQVVAEIKLSKTCLRLGEELTCLFTFPTTSSTVFQLSVELCGLEVLDRSVARPEVTAEGLINSKIYRRREISCWMHRQVSTSFSIPSIAMCSLESDIISHSWQLQVVFVCAKGQRVEGIDAEGAVSDELSSLEPTPMTTSKSVLTCSFPLTIIPCIPISQICI